ncbi:PREDICTED: poly [ADP-ribose] polymerase 9-like [Elephantulus edwardii]|uniref:poly [ADP-ribose] polymerase 9-like n=1 Tax=Elephantulus edwardii TaxID=28737 RepID=UPI0003F0D873|nr:PREDICTED: poly [ADP-ribose] polymerase 9-like [Elephantulus edwardii]
MPVVTNFFGLKWTTVYSCAFVPDLKKKTSATAYEAKVHEKPKVKADIEVFEIDILSDSCCRQLSFQHHGFKTCKIHESPLYDDLQNNYGFYTMAPPALGRQIVFKKTLRPGVELSVWKDDLTTHAVDAVVNAANGDLQHGGGLARALVSAGGYEIQEESRSFVARYGRVPTGEIAVTGAGRLPCKLIIHAVGPRWTKRDKERCIEQLKRVIRNILDYVLYENLDIQSVAIPAISSGIFQFPLDLCTCIIVETIKAYNYYKLVVNQLKEIHLVSNENATTDSFKRASELILGRNELDSWVSQEAPPFL